MNSKPRHHLQKIISILLVFVLAAGLMPAVQVKTVSAEEYETGEKAPKTGKDIYNEFMNNIDPPEDFNEPKDPYGYGMDEPFTLATQEELFVYRTKPGGGTQKQQTYIKLKANNTGKPLTKADDGEIVEYNNINSTMSYLQMVSFDPNGTGRKDHIAMIGATPNKNVWVRVIDKEGNWKDTKLGTAAWMEQNCSLNNDNMFDFNAMNFLTITAGDYNGDGRETIVAYACLDRNDYGLFELSPDSDGNYVVKHRDGNNNPVSRWGMLHDKYPSIYREWLSRDNDNDWVDNKLCCDLDTGDLNGDGIDDLIALSYVGRVTHDVTYAYKMYSQVTDLYRPLLSVRYGSKGYTGEMINNYSSRTGVWQYPGKPLGQYDSSKVAEWVSMVAGGLAAGDIDADGKDEIVLSGIKNVIEGQTGKKVEDPYTISTNRMVNAVYSGASGSLTPLMFDSDTETNKWTRGGNAYGGFYAADTTTGDQCWQRTAVETVAINGRMASEYIFINGDLYSYNAANRKMTPSYQPEYFKTSDEGADSLPLQETYFRSVAVGVFDGNDAGREQVVFVLGGIDANAMSNSSTRGRLVYMTGMLGGVYKTSTGESTSTANSFYCTSRDTISNNYWPGGSTACQLEDRVNYAVCAWDINYDGLRAKYVGKEYKYTDPEVVAIIQAPPYFEALRGATEGSSTSYKITTSYQKEISEGNSVSWGLNFVCNWDSDFIKMNAEAGYATDWSKTFTKGIVESYEDTYVATYDDQVVLYRTPVTIYRYQVEAENGFSEENVMMFTFPGAPEVEQIPVELYNEFASYYNEECKKKAAEVNKTLPDNEKIKDEDIPSLNQIEDQWLGNEGHPERYMKQKDDQAGRKVLQKSPITFGTSGGRREFSWLQEHSSSEETKEAHGFNFDFSILFGLAVYGGVHTSLTYMKEHCVSTTKTSGQGAGCSIGNMEPTLLDAMGIPMETAELYGFKSQMVSWPSSVKTMVPDEEDLMDPSVEDDKIKMVEAQVPIYGYMLSYVSTPDNPTSEDALESIKLNKTELTIPAESSEQLNVIFIPAETTETELTWKSSDTKIATVDANGNVTAKSQGTATITATSKTNSNIKATCKVNVLFKDVTDPKKAVYKAVYDLAGKGVVKGYGSYFDVNGECTRAQFVLFLWRLAGKPAPKSTNLKFSDAADIKKLAADYTKAIAWGNEKGIVMGYTSGANKGKFKPNDPCTRGQVVLFLWRYAGKPGVSGSLTFADADEIGKMAPDYSKAILWANTKKITTGYSDNTFRPNRNCTRGECVTFLYRM